MQVHLCIDQLLSDYSMQLQVEELWSLLWLRDLNILSKSTKALA